MADAVTNPANAVKPPRSLLGFHVPLMGVFGALFGYIAGQATGLMVLGVLGGAVIGGLIAFVAGGGIDPLGASGSKRTAGLAAGPRSRFVV